MKKNIVLINGVESIIIYRQSHSDQKEEPKLYTPKVMNALSLLLDGNGSIKHEIGITTLKAFSTMEGNNKLNDTRVSNAIAELRKVIPKSGLITFRYLGEKVDRYALISDKNIIDFASHLLEEIRAKISKILEHKKVVKMGV